MRVRRFDSAGRFLDHAMPFLLRAEVENNLVLGLAGDLAAGRMVTHGPVYFAVVEEGQEIRLAAFSTLPDRVGVTRSADAAALAMLADDIMSNCPEMQVVLGPEPTAGTMASLVGARLGSVPVPRMNQRIYELRQLETPANLPAGTLRPAVAADLELVTSWIAAFMEHSRDRGDPGEVAHDRIVRRLLYLWEIDRPVSMAAWTGQTPHGVRVNFVYTPEELRGRGYATACVAELSRVLLRTNRYCCLYTDLANPTSNAIYSRIGYRPVSDAGIYTVRS